MRSFSSTPLTNTDPSLLSYSRTNRFRKSSTFKTAKMRPTHTSMPLVSERHDLFDQALQKPGGIMSSHGTPTAPPRISLGACCLAAACPENSWLVHHPTIGHASKTPMTPQSDMATSYNQPPNPVFLQHSSDHEAILPAPSPGLLAGNRPRQGHPASLCHAIPRHLRCR